MNDLRIKLDKQGGKQLLWQYAKAGVLPYAAVQFIFLGSSQKALELLRNAVRLKVQQKLEKKFTYVLEDVKDHVDRQTLPHDHSDMVWVCWLQGMENAPVLVKRCYQSLQKNLKNKEIVVLTQENFGNYVEFPEHIISKYQKGIITRTHFTDLLRLALLIQYGGMWIDATVLCTDENIPSYIWDSELFFYQVLKPGRDGQSITMSSWLISACTNNLVLIAAQRLLYEYWKNYDYMVDYGLLHMFISIVLEYFPKEHQKIPQMCNSIPHILLLEAFEPFDEKEYQRVKSLGCFHKLSDKRPQELLSRKGTYYDVIIRQGKGV